MKATITYTLSAAGQKAALLAGKGGEKERSETIEIPDDAVDLFDVDSKGELSANVSANWPDLGWSQKKEFDGMDVASAIVTLRERANRIAEKKLQNEAESARKAAEAAEKKAAQQAADLEILQGVIDAGTTGGGSGANRVSAYTHHDQRVTAVRVGEGFYSTTYDRDDAVMGETVAKVCAILEAEEAALREKNKAEETREALIKRLPVRMGAGPALTTDDGKIKVTCPSPFPKSDKDWAKHVTSVDKSQANGMAFEGEWMKQGDVYLLEVGDLVVVGGSWWEGSRKHGRTVKARHIYVTTPAGLILQPSNGPETAARLLDEPPIERALSAMKARLELCEARIKELRAIDLVEFEPVKEEFQLRLAGCVEHAEKLRAEIAVLEAEPPVRTVEEAAAAIVSAGYRALAAKNHPDQGGSIETMKLLNQAREALKELLTMAKEEVAA